MFLLNSRCSLFSATPPFGGVPFFPKLQSHFAEFLKHYSSNHLSILNPLTCNGLKYGKASAILLILNTFQKKLSLRILKTAQTYLFAVENLKLTVTTVLTLFSLLMPTLSLLICKNAILFKDFLYIVQDVPLPLI